MKHSIRRIWEGDRITLPVGKGVGYYGETAQQRGYEITIKNGGTIFVTDAELKRVSSQRRRYRRREVT